MSIFSRSFSIGRKTDFFPRNLLFVTTVAWDKTISSLLIFPKVFTSLQTFTAVQVFSKCCENLTENKNFAQILSDTHALIRLRQPRGCGDRGDCNHENLSSIPGGA